MLDVKALGAQTELQCITYLHGLGYNISIPWGDNARYDFVLDVNHKLYKIQCKTAHMREEGVYGIQTRSTYVNSQGNRTASYAHEDVDFFSTFIDGKCYLVPWDETCKREKVLRFVEPKNHQTKGITFAQEYLAEKQISQLT